jgi:acyl-CoA reductase-like NAD-dependent aldehyde dehydrogenase
VHYDSAMPLESINPATGERVAAYPEMTCDELDAALARAAAFDQWRRTSWGERRELLCAVAAVLRTRQAEYARLMAVEWGNPCRRV